MKNVKEKILELVVKNIKKTAFSAAGTTSYWLTYQPKEPKSIQ